MRPRYLTPFILLLALAFAITTNAETRYQASSVLETHSDRNSPDDYIYTVFSATRPVSATVIANPFVMMKYNVQENSSGGHSGGVNFLHMISDRIFLLGGYTYTKNGKDSTRLFEVDRDRFRIGLFYNFDAPDAPSQLIASVKFVTQTNWADNKSVDFGLSYKKIMNTRLKSNLGFGYTYGLGDLSMHLYNQWTAGLTYKINDSSNWTASYVYVDKAFTGPSTSIVPDDDNVFRSGISYSY